jgi:peptidase M28-like protein
LVASVFLTSPVVAQLQYQLIGRDVVLQRLQDAPMKNSGRVLELEKMFREVGCTPTEQPVKGLHEPNVLCLLPGNTESLIVVGGHLDHVEEGTGVVDDWSGASMLPSLYQSLASHPRNHTFLFIGFAGEEKGMVGSEFYAKHLTAEERKTNCGDGEPGMPRYRQDRSMDQPFPADPDSNAGGNVQVDEPAFGWG